MIDIDADNASYVIPHCDCTGCGYSACNCEDPSATGGHVKAYVSGYVVTVIAHIWLRFAVALEFPDNSEPVKRPIEKPNNQWPPTMRPLILGGRVGKGAG